MGIKSLGKCVGLTILYACVIEISYLIYSIGLYKHYEQHSPERSDLIHRVLLEHTRARRKSGNFSKVKPKPPLLLLWERTETDNLLLEDNITGKCIVTYDRKKISMAKAIIFDSSTIKGADFPWRHKRKPEQIYVWSNRDVPSTTFRKLQLRNETLEHYSMGFFNWTMTYRLDADVVWGHSFRGDLLQKLPKGKSVVDEIIQQKTRLAMWIVNDCQHSKTTKYGMAFVNDLIDAGLNITRKGSCFQRGMLDQEDIALQTYKFYFAFENAYHCKDYITEKYWYDALQNGVVPVVMGPMKNDVLKVAPLDSFIYVEDFAYPEHLAKYLRLLGNHKDAYRNFFRWRENKDITDEEMIQRIEEKYPEVEVQRKPKSLCESVIENNSTKTVVSLLNEIYGDDEKECLES